MASYLESTLSPPSKRNLGFVIVKGRSSFFRRVNSVLDLFIKYKEHGLSDNKSFNSSTESKYLFFSVVPNLCNTKYLSPKTTLPFLRQYTTPESRFNDLELLFFLNLTGLSNIIYTTV